VRGAVRPDGEERRAQERPPRDPRRPLHPQDLDRRAAAVLQRPERQSLAGGPAAARAERADASPPLSRGRGRLFRPPPRQARRHRLGADQWLARRDRQRHQDPHAHRLRSRLYRELVAVAGPEDPVPDPDPPARSGERLLSAAASGLPRAAIEAKAISLAASAAVAAGAFLQGFVVREPAPYELFMVGVMAVWGLFGLRLSRHAAILLALLVAYNIGGVLSMA